MLVYYCGKCRRQNPSPQCDSCGKRLTGTSVRYIWSDYRLPVLDAMRVRTVFAVVLLAILLLILAMTAFEFIETGAQALTFLTGSGVLPTLMLAFLVAVALGLLLLMLQGRESVQYVLDPKGALKRTWIQPTRLKCWARLVRYDRRSIQPNAEGVPFLMVHEEYLVWQDTARFVARPRVGRINLYRPHSFVFMTMYAGPEEFDGAVEMIAAKVKPRR
ncbi:MAG: hypothetical protein GX810_07415 [Clostridiales bacterium]|nr:hypothetical protein [Clostridiales bacterium]